MSRSRRTRNPKRISGLDEEIAALVAASNKPLIPLECPPPDSNRHAFRLRILSPSCKHKIMESLVISIHLENVETICGKLALGSAIRRPRANPTMGRKASIQETVPHPSPRFRESVRLHRFRRGPTDDIWCATFRLDGKWQTRKPINLGTRDVAEAAEVARDKFTLATSGQAITRTYKAATPPHAKVEHPLRLYAERAVARLRQEADKAKNIATGKAHNALALIQRIEKVWVKHWGDSDITKLTENGLNDWLADTYRVVNRAATASSDKPIFKKASKTTIGNLDWALRHIWQEAVADKIVDRRSRPMLDKGLGEDGEARAFIDVTGVQAVARVMTDEWVATKHKRERPGVRRMLRAYIAMIACTGIRAGLEAKYSVS